MQSARQSTIGSYEILKTYFDETHQDSRIPDFSANESPLSSRSSAQNFVMCLCQEALEHPGVHHPYLAALESGSLPNLKEAWQDFAFQYGFYTAGFTDYMTAVLNNIEDPRHQKIILSNLEEEEGGNPAEDSLWEQTVPHTQLFMLFQEAIGVDSAYLKSHSLCKSVKLWRDQFFNLCSSANGAIALGAIGLGTEFIVPSVYQQIYLGLQRVEGLTEEDTLFFSIHYDMDQEHSRELIGIAVDLAENQENRAYIRQGMQVALKLRQRFWDVLLTRASR